MVSFTQLTTEANELLTFTDNRPANVLFDWPAARNISVTILSNTFTAQRKINITEIIQPTTANVEYHIDVSAVAGTTVTWSTIPSGCSVAVAGGVYIMQGIDSVEDWLAVAAPTITTPITFNGSFIYTSSIKYTTPAGRLSKSWTVGTYIPVSKMSATFGLSASYDRVRDPSANLLSVGSISALLEESGLTSTTTFDWSASSTATITGNPLVTLDSDDGSSWTVTLTANNTDSISSLSTSGTGGTSSYDNGTKTLTLTGTIAQVNSHLNTISFTSTSTKQDFTFIYTAESAAQSTGVFTRNQTANCLNLDYLGPIRGTPTYRTALSSVIGTSLPLISDPDYTGSLDYTYTITPTNPEQVTNITDAGVERYYEHDVSNITKNIVNVAGVDSTGTYLFVGTDGPDILAMHEKNVDGLWTEIFNVTPSPGDNDYASYMHIGNDATMSILVGTSLDTEDALSIGGASNPYYLELYRYDSGTGYLARVDQWQAPDDSAQVGTTMLWGNWAGMSGDGTKIITNWENDLSYFVKTSSPLLNRQQYLLLYTESGGTVSLTDTLTVNDSTSQGVRAEYNYCMSSDGNWFALKMYDSLTVKIYDISADSFSLSTTITLGGSASDYVDGDMKFNANNYLYVGAPAWQTNTGRIFVYNTSGTLLQTRNNPAPGLGNKFGLLGPVFDKQKNEIKFNNAGTQFTSRGHAMTVASNGSMTHDTSVPWTDLNLVPFNSTSDKWFTFTEGQTDLYEYYFDFDPGSYTNDQLIISGTKTELNNNIDSIELTSASSEAGNIELTISLLTPETNTESKTITVINQGS